MSTEERPKVDLTAFVRAGASNIDDIPEGGDRGDAGKVTPPPVEQKPAEQKPAEQKPAEEKPAEQKPAEDKTAEQKPAEQKPAEDKPKEGIWIPKSRFDEVNDRLKNTQRELETVRAAQKTPEQKAAEKPAYDFAAKETEYANLVLDGKTAEAATLRAEITRAQRDEILNEVRGEMAQLPGQIETGLTLRDVVSAAQSEFPQFVSGDPQFNPEANHEALVLFQAYQNDGLSPPVAMQKAIDRVIRLYELAPPAEQKPAEEKPAEEKPAEQKPDKDSLQKKIEMAERQPPAAAGTQAAPDKNVLTMSDKEFNSLSEEALRKARGDYV